MYSLLRNRIIIISIRTKCTNTQKRKNNKVKQQWQHPKYNKSNSCD